jgi:hypothetical protein
MGDPDDLARLSVSRVGSGSRVSLVVSPSAPGISGTYVRLMVGVVLESLVNTLECAPLAPLLVRVNGSAASEYPNVLASRSTICIAADRS